MATILLSNSLSLPTEHLHQIHLLKIISLYLPITSQQGTLSVFLVQHVLECGKSESGQLVSRWCLSFLSRCQQVRKNSSKVQNVQQISLHHVCQILCISWQTDPTYVDPHWSEVAHLCTMQQIIQSCKGFEEPHAANHSVQLDS